MLEVARAFGVTVTLWRRVGHQRLVLTGVAEGESAISIRMNIGQHLPLMAGAAGRVVAAFGGLEPGFVAQEFGKVRWQRPLGLDEFRRQVARTKRQGWFADQGGFARGAVTLAVPVLRPGASLQHVCSASFFEGQRNAAEMAQLAQELAGISRRIATLPALD